MICVVFLCTGNSIRSQMAEAYLRDLGQASFEVYSAGLYPGFVHPLVLRVLAEEGIDASTQHSCGTGEVPLARAHRVITLSEPAERFCVEQHINSEHWPVEDPALFSLDVELSLARFRRVRDMIRIKVADFIRETELKR